MAFEHKQTNEKIKRASEVKWIHRISITMPSAFDSSAYEYNITIYYSIYFVFMCACGVNKVALRFWILKHSPLNQNRAEVNDSRFRFMPVSMLNECSTVWHRWSCCCRFICRFSFCLLFSSVCLLYFSPAYALHYTHAHRTGTNHEQMLNVVTR